LTAERERKNWAQRKEDERLWLQRTCEVRRRHRGVWRQWTADLWRQSSKVVSPYRPSRFWEGSNKPESKSSRRHRAFRVGVALRARSSLRTIFLSEPIPSSTYYQLPKMLCGYPRQKGNEATTHFSLISANARSSSSISISGFLAFFPPPSFPSETFLFDAEAVPGVETAVEETSRRNGSEDGLGALFFFFFLLLFFYMAMVMGLVQTRLIGKI
jgi:hypothetical protein